MSVSVFALWWWWMAKHPRYLKIGVCILLTKKTTSDEIAAFLASGSDGGLCGGRRRPLWRKEAAEDMTAFGHEECTVGAAAPRSAEEAPDARRFAQGDAGGGCCLPDDVFVCRFLL